MTKLILSLCLLGLLVTPTDQSNWLENWEEAQSRARQTERPILLVFCGLDWCRFCIVQEREIYDDELFQDYAKENLVLMQANFPRKRKNKLPQEVEDQNKQLANIYNPEGSFPFNVLVSPEGEVIGTSSYQAGGPKNFIKMLEKWQGR